MKGSYTGKKRTSIALDPDLTKRLDKVLGDKKLSQFARDVLTKELETIEMRKTVDFFKKLGDSGQYLKIKRLETDIESLKKDYVSKNDYKEMKTGLKAMELMLDIVQKSAAIDNVLAVSTKKLLLKEHGKERLRKEVSKSIKDVQKLGITVEMFGKILKKIKK